MTFVILAVGIALGFGVRLALRAKGVSNSRARLVIIIACSVLSAIALVLYAAAAMLKAFG